MEVIMQKRLTRSATDSKILGICGGLAEYFEIDSTMVRLAWALSVIFAGLPILLYFICALIIPGEDVV
jgi:phage shock protein PspC (stress-responsive transcriptional regulator)